MSKKVIFGKESQDNGETIFISGQDFQSPPLGDEYSKLAIEELNKLKDLKFQNIPFPKLFVYKEDSLWWFIFPQIFPILANTLSFVTNFSKFLDEINPESIKVTQDYSRLSIITQICAKKNVKLSYSPLDLMKYQLQNKIKSKIKNFGLKFVTWKKIRKRRSIYFKKGKSLPNLENKILFPTLPVYRRGIINTQKSIPEIGEYFTQEIVDLIHDNYQTAGIDLISEIKMDDHTLIERLNSEMEWFPLEIFLVRTNSSAKKMFLKNYSNLISSTEFQKLFNFKDIDIWDSLRDIFEKMKFGFYLPYYLNLIDSLTELFLTHKPKAIVLLFETGPISLGFINVCKKYNIKTISLQHGYILKLHKNYSHNKFSTTKEPYLFPLPDKLLLHGSITKKILEEKGYPSDRLVTFGNPVYFSLDKKEKILSNQPLFNKFQIDKKKKTILFLTSGITRRLSSSNSIDFETRIWIELLKNFGDDENYQFILKPHPAEDPTKFQNILKENSFNNFQVIQGNLMELIFASSLVVSTFSSSIFDAICMKKPVIQLDNGDSYSTPLDDYEDVVIKSNLSELSSNIRLVFSDSSIQKVLLKNAINFINEAYNLPEKNPSDILKKIIN